MEGRGREGTVACRQGRGRQRAAVHHRCRCRLGLRPLLQDAAPAVAAQVGAGRHRLAAPAACPPLLSRVPAILPAAPHPHPHRRTQPGEHCHLRARLQSRHLALQAPLPLVQRSLLPPSQQQIC